MLGRLGQVSHPLLVALVGALFALSFDTLSQAAFFALTATQFGGWQEALVLALLFMLGMLLTDGINGLWIARLIARADQVALVASRVMALAVSGISLLVALGCSREEVLLHERDAQGLCAYVGTYCSDKFLGVCLTKKKVYCCFESKLSRILQEQGRRQLPKPWDKPKEEQCGGFTLDEFARLDLSQMDFSEVYAEFTEAARLPDELETSILIQQKIEDYYARSGQ